DELANVRTDIDDGRSLSPQDPRSHDVVVKIDDAGLQRPESAQIPQGQRKSRNAKPCGAFAQFGQREVLPRQEGGPPSARLGRDGEEPRVELRGLLEQGCLTHVLLPSSRWMDESKRVIE